MDRNSSRCLIVAAVELSLSARRAWIEIGSAISESRYRQTVALRKESVDRNAEDWLDAGSLSRSLSARRAWIEICPLFFPCWLLAVALRKESVDRNCKSQNPAHRILPSLSARRAWIEMTYVTRLPRAQVCRSPQGERG